MRFGGLTIVTLFVIGGFCLSGSFFGQRRAEKLQSWMVTDRPDFFHQRLTTATVIGWICVGLGALGAAVEIYRFLFG